MTDNVASTVNLGAAVAAPASQPAVAPATPATPVLKDLGKGFKADGTPRLRRMRGTGPTRRSARPRATATYFAVNGKTGAIVKLETEEAVLEYLAGALDAKDTTVIRGQQLVTTMRVVLAEVK